VLGFSYTAPVKGGPHYCSSILVKVTLSSFPYSIRVIFWQVNDGLSVELLPLEYVKGAINHCLMKLKWSCQLLMVSLRSLRREPCRLVCGGLCCCVRTA
jgi:hypothetical protein